MSAVRVCSSARRRVTASSGASTGEASQDPGGDLLPVDLIAQSIEPFRSDGGDQLLLRACLVLGAALALQRRYRIGDLGEAGLLQTLVEGPPCRLDFPSQALDASTRPYHKGAKSVEVK